MGVLALGALLMIFFHQPCNLLVKENLNLPTNLLTVIVTITPNLLIIMVIKVMAIMAIAIKVIAIMALEISSIITAIDTGEV